MESDDGIAAVQGGERLDVVTAFGIDGAVPVVAVAVLSVELLEYGVVDRQVQRHYAVAVCCGRERLRIFSRGVISHTVPFVLVAGGDPNVTVRGGIDLNRDNSIKGTPIRIIKMQYVMKRGVTAQICRRRNGE